MTTVGLLFAGSLALYCGFFYLLALCLQMGAPLDAVWAGLARTGLSAAATLVALVVHIFFRLAHASPESMELVGEIATWILRAAVWAYVLTRIYRVTRWRKGKLAFGMAAGLALNFGIDAALHRAAIEPAFGTWVFRLC